MITQPANHSEKKSISPLALAALGVVYGDIGTSPLYAMRESFHPSHGIPLNPENIFGVVSLIFWSLISVISIKYLVFVLRADNRGEGGILALTALATPMTATHANSRRILLLLGLFGTALLYGDGMITPAISVLSAIEGLEVATPVFAPYIIPITIVVLIALFSLQNHGTAVVGRIFGPITLLWFLVLAALGVWQILQAPRILAALLPNHAIDFFFRNGWNGFFVLGSVFLVVTGGEALYSDLGHFGKAPIRLAWFSIVLPALLLNYLGQGALLLRSPELIRNPFYLTAPKWMLFPLVCIATAAAVIASQALITAVFSLSMQSTQLGYIPRIFVRHTSHEEFGQIYVKGVNWILLGACIGLVLGFQSSSALAAAYGVAVTTTMVITTLLFYVVAREKWNWSRFTAGTVCGSFLILDLAFWSANLLKIPHGGWFPLIIASAVFTMMATWKNGRKVLGLRLKQKIIPRSMLLEQIKTAPPHRVGGTAVFMSGNPTGTPPALIHMLEHMQVLHQYVIFLSVVTAETPHISSNERISIEHIGDGLYSVVLRYGFMEDPHIPRDLKGIQLDGYDFNLEETTYILGRENLIPTKRAGMALWREKLFSLMSKNAKSAAAYFHLPPERVIEIGIQVEL